MASETTPLSTDDKDEDKKPAFSSRVAIVCSCLSASVGTGNIWRFPRILAQSAGDKGALCFLIVWVLFLGLWSVPLLIVEYTLGRYTRASVLISFKRLLGNKASWCGLWIVAINFTICCYYTVVLGWSLFYVYQSIFYPLPTTNMESEKIFWDFAGNSYWPVLTQVISAVVSALVLLKGVRSLEKVNLVIAPLLITFLLFIFFWAVSRPRAVDGLKFMFTPDWATLGTPKIWLNAASQNAFDTSAGNGLYTTFAAYMTRKDPVVKFAVFFPIVNNIISLICGMTVMSTVYASELVFNPNATNAEIVEVLRTAGPASSGITFIGLPVLFSQAGGFGRAVAIVFFLTLLCAALSSNVAIMQVVVNLFVDFGANRNIVLPVVTVCVILVGLGSSLSIEILSNQDFTWGYALLISGLMFQLLVIVYGTTAYRNNIINALNDGKDWNVTKIWEILVKFVLPLETVLLLGWWVVGQVVTTPGPGQPAWYQLGATTLITVLIQWLFVIVVISVVHGILLVKNVTWYTRRPWDDVTDKENRSSAHNSYQLQPT